MIGSTKLSIGRILCDISIFFSCLYIFFWENKLVHSGLAFVALGLFSVFFLIIKRHINANLSVNLLIFIVAFNLIGQMYSKADFNDAIDWLLRLIIACVFFTALTNAYISINALTKAFFIITSLFVVGVISEYFKLSFVDNINNALLKQDSITNNLQMRSWGFYAGFSGYNIVSAIMAMMLLFIALSIFYNTSKRGIKLICLAIALIAFITVIITQKRGIFVACLVAVVFLHWLERMHKQSAIKQIAFFASIIVTIGVVYYFLQSSSAGELFLRRFNSSDDISTGRFDIAQTLLSNWGDYFLFGNGPSATKVVFAINAHNNYLQIFYENGIIGLVLYMVFFVKNLTFVLKRLKQSKVENDIQYIVFISTSLLVQIAFLVYSFFGNPMNDLFIFLIYILFSALPYSDGIQQGHLRETQRMFYQLCKGGNV